MQEKVTMFFPTEKSILNQAKKSYVKKLEEHASALVDNATNNLECELKQKLSEQGFTGQEIAKIVPGAIERIKERVKEKAAEEFLEGVEKIDNRCQISHR